MPERMARSPDRTVVRDCWNAGRAAQPACGLPGNPAVCYRPRHSRVHLGKRRRSKGRGRAKMKSSNTSSVLSPLSTVMAVVLALGLNLASTADSSAACSGVSCGGSSSGGSSSGHRGGGGGGLGGIAAGVLIGAMLGAAVAQEGLPTCTSATQRPVAHRVPGTEKREFVCMECPAPKEWVQQRDGSLKCVRLLHPAKFEVEKSTSSVAVSTPTATAPATPDARGIRMCNSGIAFCVNTCPRGSATPQAVNQQFSSQPTTGAEMVSGWQRRCYQRAWSSIRTADQKYPGTGCADRALQQQCLNPGGL
jgi:hypothetical protein